MKRPRPAPRSAPARPSADAERHLPRELPRDDPGLHRFGTPEGEWLAWIAGRSVGGTGSYNLALIEAVHFARAERPDRPLREALLGRGKFAELSDAELVALLAAASPLEPGD